VGYFSQILLWIPYPEFDIFYDEKKFRIKGLPENSLRMGDITFLEQLLLLFQLYRKRSRK